MTTRLYNDADYATFSEWFIRHGSQAVPAAMLPRCGVVVVEEEMPLAAAWLYQDNSVGIAWMAWLVTNPDQPLFHVEQALRVLVQGCEAVAKGLDYGVLFTMTERPALGRFLQREGFAPNHQGMTQFFKPLT